MKKRCYRCGSANLRKNKQGRWFCGYCKAEQKEAADSGPSSEGTK